MVGDDGVMRVGIVWRLIREMVLPVLSSRYFRVYCRQAAVGPEVVRHDAVS